MKHEMHDATFVHGAEFGRSHAEVIDIMWQESAGGREEERKAAGEDEPEAGEREQRTAIADERGEEVFGFDGGRAAHVTTAT